VLIKPQQKSVKKTLTADTNVSPLVARWASNLDLGDLRKNVEFVFAFVEADFINVPGMHSGSLHLFRSGKVPHQ